MIKITGGDYNKYKQPVFQNSKAGVKGLFHNIFMYVWHYIH